jgi:methionyl-tRNA formyltransferase
MTTPLRIFFLGSGSFGLPTLEMLHRQHTVVGIVSQPDRPAGRGRQSTPTAISQFALDHSIMPLIRPDNINDPQTLDQLRSLETDAWVVIAFGQKLSEDLLRDRNAMNLHASLLPRWRGAAPINAAIIAQDASIGNSVITLANRMDAGYILAQQSLPLDPNSTASEAHDLLADNGPELIAHVLDQQHSDKLAPLAQDESLVTLAPKLKKTDGWVDFTKHASECRARIHGLSPWPGVVVQLQGKPLKLLRVAIPDDTPDAPPGSLFDPASGLVACGNRSALKILEIQLAGKRIMSWADLARGRQLTPDIILQGAVRSC